MFQGRDRRASAISATKRISVDSGASPAKRPRTSSSDNTLDLPAGRYASATEYSGRTVRVAPTQSPQHDGDEETSMQTSSPESPTPTNMPPSVILSPESPDDTMFQSEVSHQDDASNPDEPTTEIVLVEPKSDSGDESADQSTASLKPSSETWSSSSPSMHTSINDNLRVVRALERDPSPPSAEGLPAFASMQSGTTSSSATSPSTSQQRLVRATTWQPDVASAQEIVQLNMSGRLTGRSDHVSGDALGTESPPTMSRQAKKETMTMNSPSLQVCHVHLKFCVVCRLKAKSF